MTELKSIKFWASRIYKESSSLIINQVLEKFAQEIKTAIRREILLEAAQHCEQMAKERKEAGSMEYLGCQECSLELKEKAK